MKNRRRQRADIHKGLVGARDYPVKHLNLGKGTDIYYSTAPITNALVEVPMTSGELFMVTSVGNGRIEVSRT